MNRPGTTFYTLLLKTFQKQLHVSKAHAFAKRNVFQLRTPTNLNHQKIEGTMQQSYKLAASSYSNYARPFFTRSSLNATRSARLAAGFHTTSGRYHGEYEWQDPKSEDEVVNVQIVDKDGKTNNVRGKVGDNLLYLAKRFEVEMEGACEASLACTTCHVYVDHDFLDTLPESTETEEDLLDQAPFLKENSRLGCQIILNKQLEGMKLILPAATKNFYVDGHKPTPH